MMKGLAVRWPAVYTASTLAVFLGLASVGAAAETITMTVNWGSTNPAAAGFEPAAKAFEATHPDVTIKYLWGTTGDKLNAMIAAGEPPDLMLGYSLAMAIDGQLLPLEGFAAKSGVKRADFIPTAWDTKLWDGHLYALPIEVDANFALVWNKDLFAKSGLDPDQGPKTIADYDRDFKKLTKFDASGSVTQVGGEPWREYGLTNTMYAWGFMFGGQFYDSDTRKITADDPNNVDALAFLKDYNDRYLKHMPSSTFPRGPYGSDLLLLGNMKVGMKLSVTSQLLNFMKKYPDTEMGVGFEPYRASTAQPDPAFQGGYAVSIPSGSKHPELAWEFARFLTATPDGTYAWAKPAGWLTAYLPSPLLREYLQDPVMSVYTKIAQGMRNYIPLIPVRAQLNSALGQAVTEALSGKKTPQAALEAVDQTVQPLLDQALAAKK